MNAASRLNHAVTEVISQTPRRGKRGRFVKQVRPRAVILEALRQEYAQKLPEPILTAEEVSALTMPPQVLTIEVVGAGCGKSEESAPRSSSETGARFVIGNARNNRWRSTPAVSAGIKPGPHPAFTPPPSAAHAARTGRAACLIVLLVAVATACIFNDTVAAAISAGPIPLLWHGLVGRFA